MDKARTNSGLLVVVRRDERAPLHRQIETSIRDSIRAGRLQRGSTLPPSRMLAADLGVSRGVVVEAYQQLSAEGYLTCPPRAPPLVTAGPTPPATAPRPAPAQRPRL